MFKIDWPCALGGVVLGYYTKGKVESAKTSFKGIYTGAIDTLKEAFYEGQAPQGQAPQGQNGQGQNGGNGNGH